MFVCANGLAFHVQQAGAEDAPALLLLHSLGTQAAIWEVPAEALSRRYRTIRPDLRGHGLSAVPPGPYDVHDLARDMLGVMDALSVAQAHVAGISLGGLVAQALAALAPERVKSLMLIDTALSIPPAQTWLDRAARVRSEGMEPLVESIVARWVTAAAMQSPEAHGLRTMLRQTPGEGYAASAEAIAAANLTHASQRLTVSTLVLVGEEDVATPLSSAQALRDAIPGARLEVVPGAAHIPTMECPGAVIAAMERFLE